MNILNKELLERASALSPGEKLYLSCASEREMETLRRSLNRDKGKDPLFSDILISREMDKAKGLFQIWLYKTAAISNITVVKQDGKEETIDLSCFQDPELQRTCNLMKEDGATDEEIEAFKQAFLKERNKDE